MSESTSSEPGLSPDEPKKSINWWRIALLLVLSVALWVIGKQTGLIDDFDVERVRSLVESAGLLGVLAYLGIFAAGELVHIPGIVFVAAALLSWGKVLGYPISVIGSLVSVSVSFVVVRSVGGKPLGALSRPWVRKILDRLDERPIRTVFILRLIFFLAPPLNYALAMTEVRYRDYLVGSALGLVPLLLGVALAFDWVLSLLT